MSEHRPLLHRPYFGLGAGLGLLGAFVLLTIAVGSQVGRLAPATALAAVGRFDQTAYDATQHINDGFLTPLAKLLNFLGGGLFNIPFRVAALILLLFLRRFRHAIAFALTWAISEGLMTATKGYMDRMRPPNPVLTTHGSSYPSGHAVAGAAIGLSLVIAFIPAGPRRRKWEWAAAVFAFAMGLSRVYLNAHWFSDVMGGVLLGAGVAITVAAVVALADRRVMGETPHDERLADDASPDPGVPGER